MKKVLTLAMGLMALGSVSASGQEVTIEAVAEDRRPGATARYFTFETTNRTQRTIKAWRGTLQIRNPFGELVWIGQLIFGDDSDLAPNGSNRKKVWMDRARLLVDYQFEDLRFTWVDLQVAY